MTNHRPHPGTSFMEVILTSALMHHDQRDPYGLIGGRLDEGEPITDAAVALRKAGLDWTVETWPFTSTIQDQAAEHELGPDGVTTTMVDRVQHVSAPTKRQVIRRDPDGTATSLNAVVGAGYQPIQHHRAAEIIQNLVAASDLQWIAGGSTHGGLRAFFQVGLPDGIRIGGLDPVKLTLVVQTRHDGGGALIGTPTATRMFCTNQLPALRGSRLRFSIAHTAAAEVQIEMIRTAINLVPAAGKQVQAIGDRLINSPITSKAFLDFVDVIYPVEHNDDGQPSMASRIRRQTVTDIYEHAEDQADIHGTRWGALQAVLAYEDWARPAIGQRPIHFAKRIVNRTADDVKLQAQHLLLAGV